MHQEGDLTLNHWVRWGMGGQRGTEAGEPPKRANNRRAAVKRPREA